MPLDPSMLEMLTHVATWYAFTGEDQWGNNTYAASAAIQVFILAQTNVEANPDTQNREKTSSTTQFTLITDGLGIKVGDKLVVDGKTAFVTSAVTNRDENLTALYQDVIATTEEES
jgi:hypothetical protein